MISATHFLPRARSSRLFGTALVVLGTIAAATVTSGAVGATGLSASSTTTTRIDPGTTADLAGLGVSGATGTVRATLATDRGTMAITTTSGLTLAYNNSWSGTASITFSGTEAAVNAGLASARMTVPAGNSSADVRLTAMPDDPGYFYEPGDQRFFEYVAASAISWTAADTAAQTRSYRGQPGYLAAPTTATVNNFITSKIAGATNVWIGLRAYSSGGDNIYKSTTYPRVWRAAIGANQSPEAGTPAGVCSNATGVCTFIDQGAYFSSWASGEPNNSGSTENAAVTNWSGGAGQWNDLDPTNTGASGYVVEFGGKTNSDGSLGTGFAGVVTAATIVTIAAGPIAPGAPAISGTATDAAIELEWNPPTDGGSPIGSYEAQIDGGGWQTVATTTSQSTVNGNVVTTVNATVGPLVNGAAHTVAVRAVNGVGPGPASNTVMATPRGGPDAPTGVAATAGDRTASVTFSAPVSDGGSAITGFTATSSPGGVTATCLGSPCNLTGLTNGVTYTFTVRASNALGSSTESSASGAVTPVGPPGAPTAVSAAAGDTTATVAFTPPTDEGGSPVTTYIATASPGGATGSCAISPCAVASLTNGASYTFTVRARNSVGDSPESSPSAAATPHTSPGAPTGVTATRGNQFVTIAFVPPVSDGGGAITGYGIDVQPGGVTVPCASSPCVVTSLANGTTYTFAVRASNDLGTGPASAAVTGTPATVPGAPTAVSATAKNATATVTFTAPASNGGSSVTGYTVAAVIVTGSTVTGHSIAEPVVPSVTCTASPCTVSGLTNGASYTVVVHAINAVGHGPDSEHSAVVTPSSVPGAPTAIIATRSNESARVTFTRPTTNGGATITGYIVTATPDGARANCSASPCIVSGLTNGTSYTFTVRATNAVGSGIASAPSVAVTPATVPGRPESVAIERGDESIAIHLAGAEPNGAPVTSYELSIDGGVTWRDFDLPSNGGPVTINRLVNGDSYAVLVRARNAVGVGVATRPVTVVPMAAPKPVSGVDVEVGNGSATISFPEPARGEEVSEYVVRITPGLGTVRCTSNPCVIEGLTNGVAYTFEIATVNDRGVSEAFTIEEAAIPAGVTTAPASPFAELIGSRTQVSWAAPLDVNGTPVTGYTVTGGGKSCEVGPDATSCWFDGLAAATEFTVIAHNAAGDSVGSLAVSTGPSGLLPSTGSDLPTGPALLMVLLGTALVAVSRRSRRNHELCQAQLVIGESSL